MGKRKYKRTGTGLLSERGVRKDCMNKKSGTHIQDELADYNSLGFSQEYHLSEGDSFVYGEVYVLGIRVARWENGN